MKSLINPVRYIINHPLNKEAKLLALFRFIGWQVQSRIVNKEFIKNYGQKSKLYIKNGWTGATGNYYCGLHEFPEMGFMLHFLRKGDYFFDIGANIGSYTILAGVENEANVISIEPIPSTFKRLTNNIKLNNLSKSVKAYNIGLGDSDSILKFTTSHDTINHVAKDYDKDVVEVQVSSFDNKFEIESISLMKIDVEGFETMVLKGMSKSLNNQNLKAIIIELNGSGGRYDFDEKSIVNTLYDYGFQSYFYNPLERRLFTAKYGDFDNLIFIRDFEFVNDRIQKSDKLVINKISF